MNRHWIEIPLVVATAVIAAVWTQNAAIAALPGIYYAADRGSWRRLRRTAA